MGFVSYPHLILQISDQTLQVIVARENFWELNGLICKDYRLGLVRTLNRNDYLQMILDHCVPIQV